MSWIPELHPVVAVPLLVVAFAVTVVGLILLGIHGVRRARQAWRDRRRLKGMHA